MMEPRPSLLERWPTGAVLLLLLTAALLPLGLVLAWIAQQNLRQTDTALVERADQQSLVAFQAVESLVARNALALRIAANGAIRYDSGNPCAAAARALAIAPAVAHQFRIRDTDGKPICAVGQFNLERNDLLVAPGDIRMWVSPQKLLLYRVGLVDGMATGVLTPDELQQAALAATDGLKRLSVS